MGWMGFGRARASVISMAAAMAGASALLGASTADAAVQLQAMFESGSENAAFVAFGVPDGVNVGGFGLLDGPQGIGFDRIGAAVYGPDGRVQAIMRTESGTAALVAFDSATGLNQGGFELSDNGQGIAFDRIGAILYGPDGRLQAILETGSGTAAFVAFDGGVNVGGFELNDNNTGIAFDRIGSILYGPDGRLQAILETGNETAAFVAFELGTGVNLGGFELNDNGVGVAFDRVGSVMYGPDGYLQAIFETGNETAALVGFQVGTGVNQGGFELMDNGQAIAFDRVGSAMLVDLGTPSAVPEPATWAMLILGLGAAGVAVRRRRFSAGRWAAARTPA